MQKTVCSWSGLGARVCLAYRGETVLRGFDDDVRTQVHDELKRKGVKVITHASPVKLTKDGDKITLDVTGRRLQLEVLDEELAIRRAAWVAPDAKFTRGYGKLYFDQATQAHEGSDFRFLHADGSKDADPSIY